MDTACRGDLVPLRRIERSTIPWRLKKVSLLKNPYAYGEGLIGGYVGK